ncbi:hypothetical protein OV079_16555 [Nannocystis pusilla]|uniref:Uncharacterized protein n=1 Tax=Nannocystis pusilla TaxID=889268 RepID=A0A9X3IWA5_9BACT|nr:hypothetical protein [Nannocystis pusilla]MCY1007137.1 hypothetical protein [Nannocystis pusilla]
MSTAIHSVKVAALKGAEIKLTVRSLAKGVTVSFCPILALRLLSALGAGAPSIAPTSSTPTPAPASSTNSSPSASSRRAAACPRPASPSPSRCATPPG